VETNATATPEEWLAIDNYTQLAGIVQQIQARKQRTRTWTIQQCKSSPGAQDMQSNKFIQFNKLK